MKDHIARAMLIPMLGEENIKLLHENEKKRGIWFLPFNICGLFHLSTIKERYGIPDDGESQANHIQRIEGEIERLDLRTTGPYVDRLDWMHFFDWNVHNRQNEMIWDYSGNQSRKHFKEMLRDEL